jgi:hypothetical protein
MPVHDYDVVARITAVVIELGYAFLFETYFNASSYTVSAQKVTNFSKIDFLLFINYRLFSKELQAFYTNP